MIQIEKLNEVINFVKNTFVGKDEIIDLLGICLIARENAFLLGPPGTAKSAIVRTLSRCIENGKNFEYLLTRFTEPNEIFGPFDIRKLKEGELVTNTDGMMPEASLVFLDEIFNANSAILNSLLLALNEKIFRRGKQTIDLPALMFIGASNLLPEDDALAALLDRFLIRIKCDNVDPELLGQVLLAGWALENNRKVEKPTIQPEDIQVLQQACRTVDLSPVREEYLVLIAKLRNAGLVVSDRRAVKFQNLLAASALISGRTAAILSDFWVLKYTWDTEEQIEILAGLIDQIIGEETHPQAHPQTHFNKMPDAEALMKEVHVLSEKWEADGLSYAEQNILKDKLRYLQSRSRWIPEGEPKDFLMTEIENLWKKALPVT